MFKKVLSSRYASIFFNALGVFSLASYIMLGCYLRFIVDLIPSCYITDALIVYVECGNGFWPEVLKFYFLYYTPIFLLMSGLFLFFGMFHSLLAMLMSSVVILSIFCAIRVAKKLMELIESTDKVRKDYLFIFMLLGFIFTPSLVVATTYSIVKPPPSSERLITIDMWHSVFAIPRNNLSEWSLVDLERPAEEPSPFMNWFRGRGKMKYPYASINVSYNQINPSLHNDDMVQIVIAPHYRTMSEEELYKKRENIVMEQYGGEPLYKRTQYISHWELYEPGKYPVYKPDLLIHKNSQGQIENILKCTPRTQCAQRIGFNEARLRECKTPEECLSCTKMCSDESLGTGLFYVSYEFDKKNLDSYFERHKAILDFIDAHTTPKNNTAADNKE